MSGYAIAHLDEIDELSDGRCPWRPVRHHFGISSFGINAWTAREPGERIINEHDEADEADRSEELYLVLEGRAVFELDGERIRRQTLHFDRLQVLKVLGPADEAARNLEIAQGVYAAYGRKDMGWILDRLDDDVSWGIESVAAGEVAPHGVRHGKQGVAAFFAALATSLSELSTLAFTRSLCAPSLSLAMALRMRTRRLGSCAASSMAFIAAERTSTA